MFVMVPALSYVNNFLVTFRDFPQRQPVGTWSLDAVMEQIQNSQKQ